MAKYAPLAVALVVIVAAGTYVHGIMTDRWNPANSERLQRFTDRVPNLPVNIGPWQGTDERISDKEFALTNCTAYVSRRYLNRETGEMLSAYIVSGTARHITIHSPDWCYQGAGYKMQGKPVQYKIDCGEAMPATPEFLTAAFRKQDLANPGQEQALRIFWTYSDDGVWRGPGWAEVYYAGRPALFKVYLICNVSGSDDAPEATPALKFAKTAFPIFNRVLFGSPATTEDEASSKSEAATSELDSDLIVD